MSTPPASAIDPTVLDAGVPVEKENLRLQLDRARREIDGLFADLATVRACLNGFQIWIGTVEEYDVLMNGTTVPDKLLMVVVDTAENLERLAARADDGTSDVKYSLMVRHPKASTI
jgi:hypothetical protein